MKEMFRKIKYFDNLSEEKLNTLSLISKVRKFNSKDILFYEGDEPNCLYYLISGSVKVLKQQGNLKQVFVTSFNSGIFIAETTMLEDICYPATIEAETDIVTIEINLIKFKNEFLNDNATLLAMVGSLSKKIVRLMNSFERETSNSVEVKISKYILMNEENLLHIKHKDIAFELNTTQETLSRVLKKFKKDGILEKTNPITIANRCKLCSHRSQ